MCPSRSTAAPPTSGIGILNINCSCYIHRVQVVQRADGHTDGSTGADDPKAALTHQLVHVPARELQLGRDLRHGEKPDLTRGRGCARCRGRSIHGRPELGPQALDLSEHARQVLGFDAAGVAKILDQQWFAHADFILSNGGLFQALPLALALEHRVRVPFEELATRPRFGTSRDPERAALELAVVLTVVEVDLQPPADPIWNQSLASPPVSS